ncbi:MAG: cellulase family glycosylhydrolase [Spirochaetales bacterium]|nr:cellulase family glycosylhydrolase [Spirochaetales bacterium]
MIKNTHYRKRKKFLLIVILLFAICGNMVFSEEIYYSCGEPNNTADSIIPLIKIKNNTGSGITWSALEIRYYFTKDDTRSSYRYICESTPVNQGLQPSSVVGTVVNISGNDYYLRITFTSSAMIPANLITAEIKSKLYIDGSTFRNQSNDYSFNPSLYSAAWSGITLYKNGNLVWGNPPSGATENPTPNPTEAPTAVPTTAPTEAPLITDVPTPAPTAAPAVTDVPTPAPTPVTVTDPPPNGGGCTCDARCSAAENITSPYTKNGTGEFCFVASCLGDYINSWNLAALEVNGVSIKNIWISSNNLPAKIDGVYYIYYKSDVGWGHFEIRGECSVPAVTDPPATDPPATNPPDVTIAPTAAPTEIPVGGDEKIWIEAESGAVYAPQILKSDSFADNSSSDCASQEIFFEVNDGSNSTGSAPSNGNMIYNFTVTEGGDYRVWARVKTPSTNDDSFWVKMDSNSWTKWDNIGPFTTWQWDIAGDYSLSTGSHTLTFAYCEDGAKFDKILITNDFIYSPTGFGDPEPAIGGGGNTYHRSDMVDLNGNLKVIGTKLCNKNGTVIQLKGLNTHGPQWYPIVINNTIPNLAQTWGIDIIRAAMYVEDFKNGDFWNGYLAHKDEMKQKIKEYVSDAIDAGIYVIIDWHIHNNPTNFTQDAKDFFAEMAQTYGSYANVLFEICNEPEYTDWGIVKGYAEQLIPVIRSNDPDENENIIIVGTPSWSQDVNVAADNPITGYSNIMYALHFYAASHQQSYRDKVSYALGKNLPIIATEWSSCDYDVSYNNFSEADTWVSFLNTNKISFINWSFCNRDDASSILKPGVSMAGPWTSSDLTAAGTWVKQKIQE